MTFGSLPPPIGGAHFGASSFQGNSLPLALDTGAKAGPVAFTLTQLVPPAALDLNLLQQSAVKVAAILQGSQLSSALGSSKTSSAGTKNAQQSPATTTPLASGSAQAYQAISSTLTQLQVAGVYPQSLFSFLA